MVKLQLTREVMQPVKTIVGTASTIPASEMYPAYAESVERFLKENAGLGAEWQSQTGEQLYNCFQGKDANEDITGSNIPGCVFIADRLGIPLITERQLQELQTDKTKNPVGNFYTDFGLFLTGQPKINPLQAKALLESLKRNGLSAKAGIVPNFNQLRLSPDANAGLVYLIKDGTTQEELTPADAYNFILKGADGLFRAFLDRDGCGYACDVGLVFSDGHGRVVRFDAEGVPPKKLEVAVQEDVARPLRQEFEKRFILRR